MATRLICWMFVLAVLLPGTANAELVGHWRFNEGTGTVALDSSGNGNDGTLTGAQWVPGQLGGALAFDGDDWVDFGDVLNIADTISIACWVNPAGLSGDNGWVARWDVYAFKSSGTSLRFTTPGILDYTAGNTTLVAGEWQHVAVTFVPNQTDGAIFYLHGVEGQRMNSTAMSAGGGPLGVGNNRWGQFYEGMIDEVRVYDHILTPEEVMDAMLGGGPELAADPSPEDEAPDVSRDVVLGWSPGDVAVTHDVYFGTTFGDVNDAAAANPLGVLASQGQDATTFDPGRLEFGQTYFWRVDEVNGAPDFTVFGGDIWSFTVEPIAYPIPAITATASSSFGASGPERTIDGS
ncbi:MAG: LamG domain-containing protein, partial [Planctomycetes bacterium]|nr:LamG domain-containing protein [Planctomycetota bacterium]